MSRVTCTNCGGAHTPWDCKRPAKKSTAEKSGSPNAQHEALGNVAGVTQVAGSGVSPPVTRQAVVKALPVDTNTADAEKSANLTRGVTAGETAPIQKRPRGRPKSITDMASYKRAKQREYRAKWRGRE